MFCQSKRRSCKSFRQLYRRLDNKALAGVCSGIADHFAIPVHLVRLGFILGAIFQPPITALIYIVAIFVLPISYGPRAASAAGPSFSPPPPPSYGADEIHRQFDQMESKIRAMEDQVTSKEFELRRKFENL